MLTFTAACRNRICVRGLPVVRLLSSQHYDSQSGVRYEISDQIDIYLLQPKANSPPIAYPVSLHNTLKLQKRNIESFDVTCKCPESVMDTLRQLQVSPFPNKRCTIQDTFSVSPHFVQTVSAKLCDAGCTHLILAEEVSSDSNSDQNDNIISTSSSDPMASIDPDEVREVVEAVLWNDVVGTPMSERVGLRALGSSDATLDTEWRDQIEEALELNVKHFDASVDGMRAPSWESLVDLFNSKGLKCNLTL